MHQLKGTRRDQLLVRVDMLDVVEMAVGADFLLVGARADLVVGKLHAAPAVGAPRGQKNRLISPEFGGRAHMRMGIDNHSEIPLF